MSSLQSIQTVTQQLRKCASHSQYVIFQQFIFGFPWPLFYARLFWANSHHLTFAFPSTCVFSVQNPWQHPVTFNFSVQIHHKIISLSNFLCTLRHKIFLCRSMPTWLHLQISFTWNFSQHFLTRGFSVQICDNMVTLTNFPQPSLNTWFLLANLWHTHSL
jgi:hypothetical protein